MRRGTKALACLLAGLVVTGCRSTNPDTDVLHAGDVAVLMETQGFSGSAAGVGLDGVIAVVDGCLGLAGDEPTLLVFPPGTSVSGEGAGLVLTVDDVELRVGDRFEAGSRDSDGAPLSAYGTLSEQAPQSCRGLPAVQVDEFVAR